MAGREVFPTALTIAGSDSGGGAGLQADLKTFASLGVHGTSVVTCVTAQHPRAVLGIQPCSNEIVRRQLEAVFAELRPAAIKTGMLYSEGIIRTVADFIRANRAKHGRSQAKFSKPPLIVDPVMVSTSGAQLLKPAAMNALRRELLPLATLITPNLPEAEILTRQRLRSVEDLRTAARRVHEQFGAAALVKGGHLLGLKEAVDIFYDGSEELLLTAPFVRGVSTHGTGCTYSAAIAGYLAEALPLSKAVQQAKEYITQAIAQSRRAGAHSVLNSFWR
jgi:hydroxymethylpyrimidine/phosphomethylpyrimidine kinase